MEGGGGGGREAQRAGSEQIEREEGKRERGELVFRLKERKKKSVRKKVKLRETHRQVCICYLYMKKISGWVSSESDTKLPPHTIVK